MGRRGSPRAHTLSGRSPVLPDHFYIPPGPKYWTKKLKISNFMDFGMGSLFFPSTVAALGAWVIKSPLFMYLRHKNQDSMIQK